MGVTGSARQLAYFVESDPNRFFVTRTAANYSMFLQLYEEVGYAPVDIEEKRQWRQRSCNTWMFGVNYSLASGVLIVADQHSQFL